MISLSYDVIVIGSGPGGQKAAIQAAKSGKNVALIERERRVGGNCVYQGTIPSKTLREAALTVVKLQRSAEVFDFTLPQDLAINQLMMRLENVLDAHSSFLNKQMERNDITVLQGRGKLVSQNSVEVQSIDGSLVTLQGDVIVLATGSRPRTPSDIDVDHEHIFDSDSILHMHYLPESMTVLGAGVIACEYASVFQQLGVKTTIVNKADRPLGFMDPEITDRFVNNFEQAGGIYLGNKNILSCEFNGLSGVTTTLADGSAIESEKVLFALGRSANVEGLGLESVGIECDNRGQIKVNEYYQTNVENIYAVGDVIGWPALASCSMEQGRRAICHALNIDVGHKFSVVPIGIYAVPELASVGVSMSEAREEYANPVVGQAQFSEIARGQIIGETNGMLRLIVDGDTERVIGTQVVGEGATELVHLGQMALLNKDKYTIFLDNVFNFPTLGESYRVAALHIFNQLHGANAES